MTKEKNYIFEIRGVDYIHPAYEVEDPIALGAELTWKEVPSVFEKIDIDFGFDHATFDANWKNFSDHIIKEISINKEIGKVAETSKSEEEFFRVFDELTNRKKETKEDINITVEFNTLANPIYLLEAYLTFVFMALNIAAPGCAEFYNLKISPSKYEDNNSDLNFSAMRFLLGWSKCVELNWPSVKKIDLLEVTKWLCNKEIFKGQVSKGRIQRLVYALLNVCSRRWPDPMETIWLSHAIETIVDSPSSNISKLLKDRLFLLLGRPEKNIKKYKKLIDSFYNLRSRIVHGEFDICHPFYNELLDKDVEEHIKYLEEHLSFAAGLIISIIQKMVKNNFSKVEFEEQILFK